MKIEEFKAKVKELGIEVTEEKLNKLKIYADFLKEYNNHTNLTSITNIEDIYLKHFYDSLTIVKVIDLSNCQTLLDFGTGAGFPGMGIKIFYPNIDVTLLDSNHKKTDFLKELKEKINVDNLTIINKRVEDLRSTHLNYFDVVTARAVTNMPVLTELAMPLVKVNKYFIAMKGSNEEEIKMGMYAIEKMDGVVENKASFMLSETSGFRNIICVKKIKNTDLKKLRSYERIIKKPLVKIQ